MTTESQMGVGAMMQMLFGSGTSAQVFQGAVGKEIAALSLGGDDALHFTFADGSRLQLADEGQSCCESRYMRTDDDLSYYVGARLMGATVEDGPDASEDDSYHVHDVQFLHVRTDRGVFTMSSHNEHNGYYGGFYIIASVESD